MSSSKNYKRDYKQENKYKSQPEQVKYREERNQARQELMKEGKVHKGDGLQVDHIKPLSKHGSTNRSNLRVLSAHQNESYARTKGGAIRTGRRGRGS